MSKVDYIDKCTNKYNFAKEKLELKNRPMIVCHNCSYKADDLDLFAVCLFQFIFFFRFSLIQYFIEGENY